MQKAHIFCGVWVCHRAAKCRHTHKHKHEPTVTLYVMQFILQFAIFQTPP